MITPVILCGGAGTRLWPLSRKSYPKQFTRLKGELTLFQNAAMRLKGAEFAPPLVVTGPDFRFIVTEQLAEIGITDATVLIEPAARNTAPAILAAALWLDQREPGAAMVVMPADHAMADGAGFRRCVSAALPVAQEGRIVTFGIRPDRPETGYGWLEMSDPSAAGPQPLQRFVEKPAQPLAEQMLASGQYLWNAGIFLFTAPVLRAAVTAHAPDLLAPVEDAVAAAQPDLDFHRLAPGAWGDLPNLSIDYAVMEKSDALWVQPYDGAWCDLGDWETVRRESPDLGDGVATGGAATALECRNTLLRSEAEGMELVGLGLEDIVVVATPDAVLVADRSRAQEVGRVVQTLKARGAPQAEQAPRDHRPWGWFETLALDDRFQVKRIVVKPGGQLSLQRHLHRAEHWIVVSGTARVTIGEDVTLVSENQSVYVPLGARHRMENPGKVPMVLIEVQTGSYLGEDDIIRYEDVYARSGPEDG
ncbi:MAG: mannose-1-phosphate guanylyltransferase/mannose-6-phosphate isomerase [Alterinioella nitratireducens]|uniref:mannose-1-phosphate guanylyltransferase/mannose-6-phosphate isomerase n=1 Tax=Alterinioella nitratireducens TaxID=2735915 RepID=UPI004059C81B